MQKLSKLRLENHPEADKITVVNNKVYMELALDILPAGKGNIIQDPKSISGNYSITPLLYGIVIGIDNNSSLCCEHGIKPGDTVAISKDVNLEPFTIIGPNEKIRNPLCSLYSFKSQSQLEKYYSDITNGPTILIDDYMVMGKIENDDEVYPVVLPNSIIINNDIIN